MHHQSFHIQPRYSRPCKVRGQLVSPAKSSDLSKPFLLDTPLLLSRRFSLLSPISPKPRISTAESTTTEPDAKFQMSPDRMNGKQTLEKGLRLVADLYGPAPQMHCHRKNALKKVLRAVETAQGVRRTTGKDALSATLLDLQDFESQNKRGKRREANMSLPNLTSLIKLKATPASPRCRLKRQEADLRVHPQTSSKPLLVLLPLFN